jgi:hypothetical protein
MAFYPYARRSEIVIQAFDDESLIYDLNNHKAFHLNHTSALIYQFCDGKHSLEEISSLVSAKLQQLVSEEVIRLAVADFKKDNLLENSETVPDFFADKSRREIIKRIGISTMIALPLVSSVIAPTALQAQSGGNLFAPGFVCFTPSECQSNNCAPRSIPGAPITTPGPPIFTPGTPPITIPGNPPTFIPGTPPTVTPGPPITTPGPPIPLPPGCA